MADLTREQRVELADRVSELLNGLSVADALDITVTVAASAVSQWLCGHGVPEKRALEVGLSLKSAVAEMMAAIAKVALAKDVEDDEEPGIDDDDELML